MSFCNSLTFIRIRTSSKAQPISNAIWLSHGLHNVNINVYSKFHHNILLSSRDRVIFTFSEFGARQSLDQWKMSFCNLVGYILLISMFTQTFIKIFHSVQEIGLFSLFQNLNLGNASTNSKRHLTISWATSCQYQCVCKILSKYSKRFKSYRHFSRTGRGQNLPQTGRGQNLHKLSGDKIKCLIIGHSMKFNFQFQLTFLGSCN